MRPVRHILLGTFSMLCGCAGASPGGTTYEEDARLYASVVELARRELNVAGQMHLHPYLAVGADTSGVPLVDMGEFEYEPSKALDLLQRQDSTLVLCQVNDQGMCAERYVVFSQITRIGERDALVVVRAIRPAEGNRGLLVSLRYWRGEWGISRARLIGR